MHSKIRKLTILLGILIIGLTLSALEPHFMKTPAVSPDGEKVCFEYMSHLWVVDYNGGEAKRLTSGEGRNWKPLFSPDGKTIIFRSNRDHYTTIYQIPSEGGTAKLISTEGLEPLDWFPNGKSLLVRGYQTDTGRNFIKLDLDGTFEVISPFAGNHASFSPDGTKIIFDKRGLNDRESYTGSHNGDFWLYDIAENRYSRLTRTEYTEQYPNWAKSGKIYYSASDGEVYQLYRSDDLELSDPEQLTNFETWSARQLSISDNERVVFEKFDELWRFDPEKKRAEKIEIEIKEDLLGNFLVKEDVLNKASNYCVSPNGQLAVFSYKFDLFAVPEKGDDVKQITFNQPGIGNIAIMDDNETIFFTAFEMGNSQLYKVNIKKMDEIEKISWSKGKYIEDIYNNGNKLFLNYAEGEKRSRLAVADSIGKNIFNIAPDKVVWNRAALHSDGRYVFFTTTRPDNWVRSLYLYDLEEKEEELIYTFDGHIGQIFWGKDNKSIFFSRDGDICRMDLNSRDDFDQQDDNWKPILTSKKEKTDEKEKDADKKDAKKKKDKKKKSSKLVIDKEDLNQRISTIVSREGWNYVHHVLDDSTLYYINSKDRKSSLRKVSYFGENDKQIYSFNKRPNHLEFNEKNKTSYYVQDNIPHKLKGKKASTIKLKYKYQYDRMKLNEDIFQQAWVEFGRGFYDKEMHDTNWKDAGKRFKNYLQYAYTPEDLSFIVEEMIGELNASHTGFYPRKDVNFETYSSAELGFLPDFDNFPKQGITVKKVYRKAKLNKPHGIKPGDVLLKIDGVDVGRGKDYHALLKNKVGEKIELTFQTADSVKVAKIKGLSYWNNQSLYYDNWVEERTKKVAELSRGEIGYLHIRSMNGRSYDKFIQDLFAQNYDKQALIIDVRNNGGGNIHEALMEELTRVSYGMSSSRNTGGKPYKTPANSWEKPMVVLINENSFSDAEIFPNLFKQQGLGKVIGMPTSGSVIGTGHHNFMDGSSMRMPMNGWWLEDGTNMEGNGVQPDILVEMTPEQIINDEDVQLKKAVEELLKEIAK